MQQIKVIPDVDSSHMKDPTYNILEQAMQR